MFGELPVIGCFWLYQINNTPLSTVEVNSYDRCVLACLGIQKITILWYTIIYCTGFNFCWKNTKLLFSIEKKELKYLCLHNTVSQPLERTKKDSCIKCHGCACTFSELHNLHYFVKFRFSKCDVLWRISLRS